MAEVMVIVSEPCNKDGREGRILIGSIGKPIRDSSCFTIQWG